MSRMSLFFVASSTGSTPSWRNANYDAVCGPLVVEFVVQEGARFDGKQVHALGLPAGCVIVSVHRDRYEVVPTPNTLLEVGNRLTVVIAPQATEALVMLRKGCESPRTRE